MKKRIGPMCMGAIFLVLVVAAISCDKKDSSELLADEAVYQDYFVSYDLSAKETAAAASLRDKNGVRLVLVRKGETVRFNQKVPDSSKTPADVLLDAFRAAITDYEYRWQIDKVVDGEFTYIKSKSKSFMNTILLKEISTIAIPSSFKDVKLDGTTVLKWEGAPVGNKEMVDVSFMQNGNLRTGNSGGITTVGGKEIKLNGVLIRGLKMGRATLILTRRKELTGLEQSDGKSNNGRRIVQIVVSKQVVIE